MSKKFLNIHVLISHSPSCLNRDDMNMQKSAVFGGARRIRISSQCLKRAMRKSARYGELFGSPSIRTRSAEDLAKALKATPAFSGFDKDLILDVVTAGMDGKDVMTAWAAEELLLLCRKVQEAKENGAGKAQVKALVKESAGDMREAVCTSIDIALSGRMCASKILGTVEASASVAHSITTHAMEAEIDWFTAMDDLKEEEDEMGAGHLNEQEFGSGVFYRYAAVDLDLLAENMGKTRKDAMEVAAGFTELMATIVPTGKQKSFASYSVADLVLATLSAMPLSAANAFEKPVTGRSGLMRPSIEALEKYMDKTYRGYGLDDAQAVFSLDDTKLQGRTDDLAGLLGWIRNQE